MAKVILGMLGFGTVGTGVVRLLDKHPSLVLKKIAVKNKNKQRDVKASCFITDKASELIDDPEIEIIIEVMGGEEPAYSLIRNALNKRKHVVTANKEVLAKHGPELFQLAANKGVTIFFEASVAGGIPLLSTIQKGLEANRISSVAGILNGTTNFILSSMESKGESFANALVKAQELGYAEADPTSDIEGHDVAYKLSILSALAYGSFVNTKDILRQGISKITPQDLIKANDFGYRIKLIGSTSLSNSNKIDVRVGPCLVPLKHQLAHVAGANNGIVVQADALGELSMIGPGAGELPTASAVVGDIINLASALKLPDFSSYFQSSITNSWAQPAEAGDWHCPYFIRLEVHDHPGVIGQIGTIFGAHNISIASIVQNNSINNYASIIIITHSSKNESMKQALAELQKKEFMKVISTSLPIYQNN